ncbi:hypothetical protein ERX46_03585 [Brumimicrobium glaciale]|uniref:DUF1269 domain-containing protein n=1 Tax=Brumimicrobium glaciale TaxID=200475 RepID=A0A4Q4KTK9_9FLAO|nr:hypothetical protein [Brumimicrobium glaciale]RYM36089.1 hypothetical protein ERX46_03585 [Brumimicrobium glaciale]
MKTHVAIYDSHEKAINATKVLNSKNFPMEHVSILGKAEITDDHIHIKQLDTTKNAPALIGSGAGVVIGLLTGIGIFTIPGFGFLYGAGALVGAFGGFEVGLVTGGIATLLATIGIKKDSVVKLHEHLNEGKFLVVVKGPLKEVEKAEHILHTEGTHLEMLD